MKKKKIQTVVRIILSIGLCYGIYTETGIWTTIFAILILIMSEFNAYISNKTLNQLRNENISI